VKHDRFVQSDLFCGFSILALAKSFTDFAKLEMESKRIKIDELLLREACSFVCLPEFTKKKKKVDSADIDKYINVITTQINVSTIQKIYSKILVVKFISQNFKKCINCRQKKSHT
jgi:hypothetical protein